MSAQSEPKEIQDATAIEDGAPQDPVVETEEPVELTEEERKAKRSACIKKVIVGLVILGFIIYVSVQPQQVRNGISAFLAWIENNLAAGVFAFIGVYFLATIFWVPGSILTLGAGFVFSAALDSLGWGVLLGTGAVWVGASAGAIASFLLGRYLFRDGFVGRLKNKFNIFQALDNALMEKGLFIMVLLRLSPIIPFNALNYIAGVTGVQFWQYAVACVAMLPGTILYVFLGASAGSLAEIGGMTEEGEETENPNAGRDRIVTIVVIVVGVIFGILAVGVTSYYAKKELNKVLEKDEAATAEGNAADEEQPAEENADEAKEGKSEEGSM